jgi:hypothetical protein
VDPIDRELASLVYVEPSPEFRARVRMRIATEPAPRAWFPWWRVVVAGLAAVVVVIAAVVGRVSLPGNGQRSPSIARSPLPSNTLAALPVRVPSSRSGAVIRRPSRGPEREVLVAASEVRGLRQLAAIVREGRIQFVFPDENLAGGAQEPVEDITIAPLAIAPIEIAASADLGLTAEGDEQ